MPEERQTSAPESAAEIPDEAKAGDSGQTPRNPPVLPDPAAFQAYLKRLAKPGTRT